MKTRLQQEQGSFLITAAIVSGILAILVFGYLEYITNEYSLNFRSQSWTQSLDLSEAGIELGMAELNFPYRLGGTSAAFQSSNGWSSAGTSGYTKSVTNFADQSGNYVGNLSVTVTNVGMTYPTVSCTATCPGATTRSDVTRTVAVILKQKLNFPYAFALKQGLKVMNGYIDSFNSSDPTESTGGAYDSTKKQANGNVVTVNTGTQAVSINNGTINGTVAVGSGGSLSLSGALIGPTTIAAQQVSTVAAGLAKGWITTGFSQSFPDVTVPTPLTSAPQQGTINNGATFTTGDYQANFINSSSSTKPIVINGNVRLYVSGSLTTSGSGFIQINSGASLQIYVAGAVTLSGGSVVNYSGTAANNQWYGLSSSTTWTISGGSAFIGTVYAPEANLTLSGGSGQSGAFVGNYATLSGGSSVHYDQALSSGLGQNFYSVVAWKPLVPSGGSWILDSN